jgi:hypothetical protein
MKAIVISKYLIDSKKIIFRARRMNANSNNRKKCGNNLTVGGHPEFDHKVPVKSRKLK